MMRRMSRRTAVVTAVVAAFAVIALPAAAYWAWSVSKSTSFSAASLAKPVGTATALSTTPPSIRISWLAPTGTQAEATYVVRRVSPAPAGIVCTVAQPETTTSCDDTNLAGLTLHTYTMEATLESWASGESTSFTATTVAAADTTAPTVTNVTSTLANGTYGIGQVVPVTVTFSESVTVTGTPTLQLETGTTDRVASYATGTGTSTLTFNYSVQTGDSSSDLDYTSTSALSGGTIKDAATNDATLTLPTVGAAGSLGNNKAVVINGVVPTGSAIQANIGNGKPEKNDTITYTYSQTMDPGSIVSGWNGSSLIVFVQVTDGGAGNDTLNVYSDSSYSTLSNLGTVNLGRTDYVSATARFGTTSGGNATTMVQSGASITVTLGQLQSGTATTAANTGTMTWTPSASATNSVGTACATTAVTESGTADKEF